MMAYDFNKLYDRISVLEVKQGEMQVENKHQTEKIDEIHKILVGNGKPGLVTEWNQQKGFNKAVKILIGVGFSVMTLAISILALFK